MVAPARADRRVPPTLVIGVVVLFVAVLVLGLRMVSPAGRHAWDGDAVPPSTVTLTAGRPYSLSTKGGITDVALRLGSDNPQLTCTATDHDGQQDDLQVTTQYYDPRLLHVIGTFVASRTGQFAVTCQSVGPVFVDDADDARFDSRGAATLLVSLLLTAGVVLVVSGAYRLPTRARRLADHEESGEILVDRDDDDPPDQAFSRAPSS